MRVLVVEDEAALARQVDLALGDALFVVDVAADGETAEFMGATEPYDAVVLDLGLPKMDGISVLKAWRAQGVDVPVLILTARSGWNEKVEGLNAGADDYLAKPFRMEELIARLKALIRRAKGRASPLVAVGDVVLDSRTDKVTVGGAAVPLTAQEYRVLSYLLHNSGRTVSRGELTEHIYAQDFDRDSNTIEVFVGRLRKKLPAGLITTVRGLGYRIDAADAAS